MKPYQIISTLLTEQDQSESDKNKKRLKHYSVAGTLAGGAGAVYGGRLARLHHLKELNEIEEEYFKTHEGIDAYNMWKASPKYSEYRRKVRGSIALGASKFAILAILTVAFYAFLRESKRKFDEAQKIKRMKRS